MKAKSNAFGGRPVAAGGESQGRSTPSLPTLDIRVLSCDALVAERTLRKYLNGGRVAAMCMARIERALRERGLDHLVRRDGGESLTAPRAH
jgi:hypothetical protein